MSVASSTSSRQRLVMGVSATTLLLAAFPAVAGNGLTRKPLDPGVVATLAAQGQATQTQAISSMSADTQASLAKAAALRQSMDAAQAAAQAAAAAAQSNVPNGLTTGGLQMASGATPGSTLWQGANAPTQTTANGRTEVNVQQTASQAILNWQTFNVGQTTDLSFSQQSSSWVVLNRITDPNANPTKILGTISAPGTVLIMNANGVIFTGTSQIDVGALVAGAANITDSQFLTNGIYSPLPGSTYLPAFTNAGGAVVVQAGAQLTTATPASVTNGGGYVLLLGKSVTNDGSITTPDGQTELAAGDNFLLRPGYGTDGNQWSTTLGNEVAVQLTAGSGGGTVTNNGMIEADTGDITLAGETIVQNGLLLATTSVNQRGTIHLLSSASDPNSSVTLTPSSVTYIALDTSGATALDAQRDTLISESQADNLLRANNANAQFDDLGTQSDMLDQSRVEIVTGGTVEFQGQSLTLAQGGQVAVSATGRVQTDAGATIDVSGAAVSLSQSVNDLLVNIQGEQVRDAPVNRDSGTLFNDSVWVDLRDLTYLPPGAGGDTTDTNGRDYTPGGLLEVSGYLADTGHTIGEWASAGGTISFQSGSVVAQQGSTFNISGGAINYQAGVILTSMLQGSDGHLYDVNSAPANLAYNSVGPSITIPGERWGTAYNETFQTPLTRSTEVVDESAYTVGKDGGQLVLSAPTVLFGGTIDAGVVNGSGQTTARPTGTGPVDPYALSQTTVALPGQLLIGDYDLRGLEGGFETNIQVGDNLPATPTPAVTDPIPASLVGTAFLSASALDSFGLGGLSLTTAGDIAINAPLTLSPGGALTLNGAAITIAANVTAHGGTVTADNLITTPGNSLVVFTDPDGSASTNLIDGATIDVSGLWSNGVIDSVVTTPAAFVNGGSVSLQSTQSVTVAAGTIIDASSGAALSPTGTLVGGTGGSVSLAADVPGGAAGAPAAMTLAGTISGYGVDGGGTLTLQASSVAIGGAAPLTPDGLLLPAGFFDLGFSSYAVTGLEGLAVAPGAQVAVTVPVYRYTPATGATPTGADPSSALQLWTPPLMLADPIADTLTQRAGGSLQLNSGTPGASNGGFVGGQATVGAGATITVDPGQAIGVSTGGQLTIDGTLNAPGGNIDLTNNSPVGGASTTSPIYDIAARSIWIGGDAVLNAASEAFTAQDQYGRAFGKVLAGGSVVLGTQDTGTNPNSGVLDSSAAFIVVRPGALIDVSGASATFDSNAELGMGLGGLGRAGAAGQPLSVPSNAGSITVTSYDGIYLDGTLKGDAGGPGAAGGTFSALIVTPWYEGTASQAALVPDALRLPRQVTVTQDGGSGLSADAKAGVDDPTLVYGQARVSADALSSGGFTNLVLTAPSGVVFDGNVNLTAGQSITLTANGIADTSTAGVVTVNAPYVQLNGSPEANPPVSIATVDVVETVSRQATTGTLTVSADLIDTTGTITFGMSGSVAQLAGPAITYDFAGFENVDLQSSGDIRPGALLSPGNFSFTAAQIYGGTIIAGAHGVNASAQTQIPTSGVITIMGLGGSAPPPPSVVGAGATFEASVINQGGVVRSPFGSLTFDAATINFLPGSITSVSGASLTVPYGGTPDGVTWVSPTGLQSTTAGAVQSGIALNAAVVNVEAGATIDLSGGGTLQGAGFASGRGGSVNVLTTPLANAGPGYSLSKTTDQVYAIVPGYAAPYSPNAPGAPSQIGEQVTVPAGVPGLPAGTYTLLPASYALLPGAFRVELGGSAPAPATGTALLQDGTYATQAITTLAFGGVKISPLPIQALITPGQTVLTYSGYNQTSYADYATAVAANFGAPRPLLPQDAGSLTINYVLNASGSAPALTVAGTVLTAPAAAGYGSTVTIDSTGALEIYGAAATPGFVGESLSASALDALNAADLVIGVNSQSGLGGGVGQDPRYPTQPSEFGSNPLVVTFASNDTGITLRTGAVLSAPEVILVSGGAGITLESGASIDTIGKTVAAQPPPPGGYGSEGSAAILAVSNQDLVSVMGGTAPITLDAGSSLYSSGSIFLATSGPVSIADGAQLGTSILGLQATTINIGSASALAGAVVPQGLDLTQSLLDSLLQGNMAVGAPALTELKLNATQSVDFFGTTNLSVGGGASSSFELDLTTPAIYGYGGAGDVASLSVGTLVWTGSASANPSAAIANGPGTGSGTLNINAGQIVFGHPADALASTTPLSWSFLGFSTVNLTAGEITSNDSGTVTAYQVQDPLNPANGSGGNLNMAVGVLSGGAGTTLGYTAGGAVNVATGPTAAPSLTVTDALGGAVTLTGATVSLDAPVYLPSGALTLAGTGNVTLGPNAQVNLTGQSIAMFDQTAQTPGGAFLATSTSGAITLAPGSSIDVSAPGAAAGSVTLSALQGAVSVGGTISGSGPTPAQSGAVSVAGQTIGDFDALNAMLDAGGVYGQRSFEIGQGDLTVDGTVTAQQIDISVDSGSLTVTGTLNASGPAPGTIDLAAGGDLTLAGSAVLDVHGTQLKVDSYGAPIDAENRGHISLTSTAGTLTLNPGATLNLSTPDGVAYGDVELNAPRSGANDTAVSASGALNISGAATIALNAFRTYTNAPQDPNNPTDQFITQAYLDGIDADSQAFINGADANGALLTRISGLAAYGSSFHLRPGVQIESATPNGDLTTSGDLDLSGYRYSDPSRFGLQADPAVYGSGEPGVLVIRAGGNLNVEGSISDGFAPPPGTPDDNGWSIITNKATTTAFALTANVPLTGSATGATTTFDITSPTTVGYALPIRATSIEANSLITFAVTTSAAFTFSNVWTTSAPITLPNGTVIPRGTIEPAGTVIPSGSTLGAGTVLPGAVSIQATTVPAGTQLDIFASLSLSQSIVALAGSSIPAGTTVPPPLAGSVATAFTAVQPFTLGANSSLSVSSGTASLGYAVPVSRATLERGVAIPFAFANSAAFTITASWTPTADIVTSSKTYPAGVPIPANTSIPAGSQFAAGSTIPVQGTTKTLNIGALTIPAGTPLDAFSSNLVLSAAIVVPAGGVVPAGSNAVGASAQYSTRPLNAQGNQGQIFAVAPMLPAGDLSWSLQLTAGANLAAADASRVNSPGALAGSGNLVLDDAHFGGATLQTPSFSVLRTGTGSLGLDAGGDIQEASSFGVYTAGTQSADVAAQYELPRGDSAGNGTVLGSSATDAAYAAVLAATGYQAYYPTDGGDVQVAAQRNLTGNYLSGVSQLFTDSNEIGNWLWRQGGANGQPAAWWINFGTYALPLSDGAAIVLAQPAPPTLTGFTGIGALGGGNVSVTVGGDAGNSGTTTNQAISVTDASTGRVQADGSLLQTGGGNVMVKVAGSLNAVPTSAAALSYFRGGPVAAGGVFTDMRGDLTIEAGSIGGIDSSLSGIPDASYGGILLTPGDGTTTVVTAGQMVIAGYADAGRAQEQNTTPYVFTAANGTTYAGDVGGSADFTLWTNATKVDLLSIGGDIDPQASLPTSNDRTALALLSDGHAYAPGVLSVVAPEGNIVGSNTLLELAPSTGGGLTLLAGQSIYNIAIDISGASPAVMATPFQPAFDAIFTNSGDNYSPDAYVTANQNGGYSPLLAFGADTPTSQVRPDVAAAIYAVNGDIVNLQLGQVLTFNTGVTPSTWYVAGQPANIRAGEDIVSAGQSAPTDLGIETTQSGLVLNLGKTDISTLQAGRDIIYSSMAVAGPGDLVVQAGRNVYGAQFSDLHSIGPLYGVQAEDRDAGANITLLAGVGADGPDYSAFAQLYFNPANQAVTADPLAGQPGKVEQAYSSELLTWLQQRFGYTGSSSGALAYFLALPTQQQGIFVRQIYYEELNASGIEFNDPSSERFKSYLRGQDAIATLFPTTDGSGNPITYSGNITLFSAANGTGVLDSGVRTDFGGAIQILDPGGEATLGVAGGVIPGPDAGLLTQGAGDIDIYSEGSVLLGQSRILTTFGGDILIWSATGDINGGQGSKTTVLFTPPSILYSDIGQVSLAPQVPSTGAGIGTLNPVPQVPPGNVDLIAPEGTVNAGEAGIRVSGNLNIAALHVVNAANIQVQGTTTGVPTTAAVNTGALSAAGAASSAVTSLAEELAARAQPQPTPPIPSTIFTVQVLGYGGDE
jgi:filamentous hemagglutinin family protein